MRVPHTPRRPRHELSDSRKLSGIRRNRTEFVQITEIVRITEPVERQSTSSTGASSLTGTGRTPRRP
ncbi:hypothetical protein RKD05_001940 [Microbacterium sp. SLBN-111]